MSLHSAYRKWKERKGMSVWCKTCVEVTRSHEAPVLITVGELVEHANRLLSKMLRFMKCQKTTCTGVRQHVMLCEWLVLACRRISNQIKSNQIYVYRPAEPSVVVARAQYSRRSIYTGLFTPWQTLVVVAQWKNVGLWPAAFHWPALDLQLMGNHLYG